MAPIVLLRIEALHVRTSTGLKLSYKGRELPTGTIVAHLDGAAPFPANTGMLDVETRALRLNWAIIAALPAMAEAVAGGVLSPKESGPVKASFDEVGKVRDDDSGFDLKGKGQISPGSLLSGAKIPDHSNPGFIRPVSAKATLERTFAADVVQCAFESGAYLDVALPKSLGGGTQRLNLVGGFQLVPVMTLARPERAKQSRR